MKQLKVCKTGQLHNYSIFIVSQYFNIIEDHINLVTGVKRFRFNFERYFYNPIPLTKKTRPFFSFLRTQYLYDKNDEVFYDDKILYYDILFQISYTDGMNMRESDKFKGKEIKFRKMYYSNDDNFIP